MKNIRFIMRIFLVISLLFINPIDASYDGMDFSPLGEQVTIIDFKQAGDQQGLTQSVTPGNNSSGLSSITVTIGTASIRRGTNNLIVDGPFMYGVKKSCFRDFLPEQFKREVIARWNIYGCTLGKSFEAFLFTQYNLYQFENFMVLARSTCNWRAFIDLLHEKLENDTNFDIATNSISGFRKRKHAGKVRVLGKVTRAIHKKLEIKPGISQFHKKINEEKDEINNVRRAQRQAYEEEQQRKREEEQRKRVALEEELKQKRVVQAEWRYEELVRQKDEQRKDVEFAESLEMKDDEIVRDVLPLPGHQELQSLEDEFEQLRQECAGQCDLEICSELGLENVENAFDALENGQSCDYERYKSRAFASHETIVNACSISNQQYDLDVHSQHYLHQLDIDPDNFINFSGMAIQHQLNSEIVSTINQTSKLLYAHVDNFHIHNFATIAYRTADKAQICSKEMQLREGFALSDVSRSFFEMGKRYAFVIAEGLDVCLSATKEGCSILTAGVGQGIQASGHNIKDFLDKATSDPVRAVSDFIDSTYDTGLTLGRLFCFMLESPGKKDSKDLRETILAFDDKIKAMSNHDRAVGAVAFGTEMLLSIGAWEFAGSKLAPITNAIKEFSTIARGELAVVTHAAAKSPIALKLTAPITEMFGDALLGTKAALEGGKDFTQKAMDAIKKIPLFLEKEIKAAETIEEFATVQKVLNKKTLTELLKKAEVMESAPHQRFAFFEDLKIIFRDDTGIHAHALRRNCTKPIDHFNIEIQKIINVQEGGKMRCSPFYNAHIVFDKNFPGEKFWGEFIGKKHSYLNRLIKNI